MDEFTFGRFVREQRESLNISVRSFAKKIGCSATYISDIETGNRQAPTNYLKLIFEELNLQEEDRQDFEDLAATRGFIYEDINPYLGQEPMARVALRTAIEKNLSSDVWENLIEIMEQEE